MHRDVESRLDKGEGGHIEHTSLSRTNFVAFFPCPASGTQISTLSCLLVSASRRKLFARLSLRVTLGRPERPPRYLMTEFVWNRCVAT